MHVIAQPTPRACFEGQVQCCALRLLAECRELCNSEGAVFIPQLTWHQIHLLGLNTVQDMIHVLKKLTFKYREYIVAANTNNGKCYETIWELGEGSWVSSAGENPGGLHWGGDIFADPCRLESKGGGNMTPGQGNTKHIHKGMNARKQKVCAGSLEVGSC